MKKLIITNITKVAEIKENKIYYNVNENIYEISHFVNPKISNKYEFIFDKVFLKKILFLINAIINLTNK